MDFDKPETLDSDTLAGLEALGSQVRAAIEAQARVDAALFVDEHPGQKISGNWDSLAWGIARDQIAAVVGVARLDRAADVAGRDVAWDIYSQALHAEVARLADDRAANAARVAASWWTERSEGLTDAQRVALGDMLREQIVTKLRTDKSVQVGSHYGNIDFDAIVSVRRAVRELLGDDGPITAAPYNTSMTVRLDAVVAHREYEAPQRIALDPAKRVALTVEYELLDEDLRDLLATAFEGGINYWCARADRVKGSTDSLTYELRLHDEPKKPMRLDREVLLNGLRLTALRLPEHFKDFINESGDATTADVIVQMSLFGEVVYG